jgi:hypothetical protein
VGTRDSALDSMAWPACAGRLRTGTSLTSFQVAEQAHRSAHATFVGGPGFAVRFSRQGTWRSCRRLGVVPMDVVAGERNCGEKSLRGMLCMAGHGA